jgi:hypothetical protein
VKREAVRYDTNILKLNSLCQVRHASSVKLGIRPNRLCTIKRIRRPLSKRCIPRYLGGFSTTNFDERPKGQRLDDVRSSVSFSLSLIHSTPLPLTHYHTAFFASELAPRLTREQQHPMLTPGTHTVTLFWSFSDSNQLPTKR